MKRKTLDEYLGINGLLIAAIIGSFFKGGILEPIAAVCGVVGIYYLIKKRKNPEMTKQKKVIGWVLVGVWLLAFGIFHANG